MPSPQDLHPLKLAVSFTNLGPYHLARLRALGLKLREHGSTLTVYETAGAERRYPWQTDRAADPFDRRTLAPDHALEELPPHACRRLIDAALCADRPDVVAVVGYARPECVAAMRWARRHRRPVVLLSESQQIDKPRVWWKEAVKARRIQHCAAALVGGPRHRAYLVELGMPEERIALGYNAVDNDALAVQADNTRAAGLSPISTRGPYLVAVNRFVPEKNLAMLLHAFARLKRNETHAAPWSLVLCGDGPERASLQTLATQLKIDGNVHFTGFLQEPDLVPYYAFASAFVHPSQSEPWGLVVNEAAACGLPLVVSNRAGCVETLVPNPSGTTGTRFDPFDENDLMRALAWITSLTPTAREGIGRRAREVAAHWGPDRFARGMLDALDIAQRRGPRARRTAPSPVRTP